MKTYKLLIVYSTRRDRGERKERVESIRAENEHEARRLILDEHLKHKHQVFLISSKLSA